MTNQLASDLRAAKALIENKENWCSFKPLDGRHCAVTATVAVGNWSRILTVWKALDHAGYKLFGKAARNVNDTLGHAAVMRMYDYAISKAE